MDQFRVLADDALPLGLLEEVARPSMATLPGHIKPPSITGVRSRPPSPSEGDDPHSQFSQFLPHLTPDQVREFIAAAKGKQPSSPRGQNSARSADSSAHVASAPHLSSSGADPTPLRPRAIHFSEPSYFPPRDVRPQSPPTTYYTAEPAPLPRERSHSFEQPRSLVSTHQVQSPSDFFAEWTSMKKELHDLRRQIDPRKVADIALPSFQYLRVPPQSELPKYRRYSGVGDPYVHLKDFVYESAPHKYDRHLMAYLFRKSLDGPALEWSYSLPPEEVEDFQTVQERFLQQFQDRVGPEYFFVDLVAEKMKPEEDFSTYADRWRSLAAKVRCPMPEEEKAKLLISNATPTYRAILAMNDISTMHQLYSRAHFIQTQLKDSPIHSMFETPKARYAKKPQGPVTEGIQTNEQVGAVSNPQGPVGRSPYTQQTQQSWNNNNNRQPPPQGQNPPQDQRQYSQVPPPQNGYAPRKPNGLKRAQYPPLPESLADVFAALMSLNALRLPPEKANWNMAADQTKYCVYHRHPGHNVSDYF
ncbi:hypothetical protein Taro_018635 [Colocasia esculenta]|uniref:Retrotransposon gag domain-containing protein n=1 Tax=Colocasia esculenta TaxID=4460 RepID=A0A843UWW7_COLES|nr:hypothetical protein [Colocasia esculenta]